MANENCLEGMRCPHCESESPFYITATSVFKVYDDGTSGHGDVEWDNNNACLCADCNYPGIVKDFKKEKTHDTKRATRETSVDVD